MLYEVNILQGTDVHTYFTQEIEYVSREVDDGTKIVMLRCVPLNGRARGQVNYFPMGRILYVTEREDS